MASGIARECRSDTFKSLQVPFKRRGVSVPFRGLPEHGCGMRVADRRDLDHQRVNQINCLMMLVLEVRSVLDFEVGQKVLDFLHCNLAVIVVGTRSLVRRTF